MESIKADRIVSINVDVQNDFCPGGSLAVTEGDHVVAPLNQLNAFVRSLGGIAVFTGDQHPATTPHFETWPVHCVAGTEGAALHPDLEVSPSDTIINKGTGQTDGYSAFEGSTAEGQNLAEIITPARQERVAVVIGGLAADYCVKLTTLDALKVDPANGAIDIYVIEEAVRGVNLATLDSKKALQAMQDAGAQLIDSTEHFVARFEKDAS